MSSPPIELSAVAGFVRQHTHEIRNHLNGFDLEAALLAEIVSDPEGVEGIERLRRQIRTLAEELKEVSGRFVCESVNCAPISAADVFLIWQDQAASLGFDAAGWQAALGEEKISVDVAAIGEVLKELLINAKHFTGKDGVAASATRLDGNVEFALRESKAEPVEPGEWGRRPFVSTKRGGYGLGLWQAAQIIAANGGEIARRYEPTGTLVTTVAFPLA